MITHLTVKDFRAIRGTREYELKAGVTAIVGPNEKGKTSTFLALAFALYGAQAMPDKIDADDIINDHARECRVTVRFDLDGSEYELFRSQKRTGTGDARLTRDGKEHASGRASVTKAITELLGVDHVGFLVSVFARQSELDALAGKQGAARVTTMLRLLGVEQAEAAIKAIRKDANDERRKLDLMRAGVPDPEVLRSQRAEAASRLESLRERESRESPERDRLKSSVQATLDALRDLAPAREAYEQWQTLLANVLSAVDTARVRVEDAQRRMTAVPEKPTPPVLEPIEPVDPDEVAAADAAYTASREKWATIDADWRRLQSERSAVSDTCPTCKRPFDDAAAVAEHARELDGAIATAETARDMAAHEGREAKQKRDELDGKRTRAALTKGENERKQSAYDQALRAYERAVEQQDAAATELTGLRADLLKAEADVESTKVDRPEDPRPEEERLRGGLAAAQADLAEVTARLAGIEAGITAAEADLARIDAEVARAQERSGEITALEGRVVTMDVAAKEMASMKERLIGRIIPALEERASAIVAELTDGKHSELHLTPDYEMQYVTETGNLRSFASLSGGAQAVFALALRLAIAELRAGSISFLVLDEVFESLDDERQGLAWEAIERLSKRYEQVLVVTHVNALKERATNLIAA